MLLPLIFFYIYRHSSDYTSQMAKLKMPVYSISQLHYKLTGLRLLLTLNLFLTSKFILFVETQ